MQRKTCAHLEPGDLREQVEQLFGEAVGEILLLFVGGEIDQGQHRDAGRGPGVSGRGPHGPAHDEVPDHARRGREDADAREHDQEARTAQAARLGPLEAPLVDVEDPGQPQHHRKADRERDHEPGQHTSSGQCSPCMMGSMICKSAKATTP